MSIKRELIMADLDTRMKAIKTTGGYLTNLGNNVFAWRTSEVQPSELPGMIYRDKIAGKRSGGPLGQTRWALAVDFIVFVEGGPTEVRTCIADLLKAIGAGSAAHWGGYAQSTELGGGTEMEIERHDKTEGAARVSINIIYDAPLWEC